jgi:hypothetical protein
MAEVEIPTPEECMELKENPFVKRVALMTAVFAVLLAISSLGGNNAMKEMLLSQQRASDQWAYYQAKAMREHIYKLEKMKIEIDLLERGAAMKAQSREKLQALYKTIAEEEARFGIEKKDIEKEAKAFEHERDISQTKDPYFDYAEVLLQIAIVMASVAILSGSRPVFYFACVAALLGATLSANGFFLFFRLPFPH